MESFEANWRVVGENGKTSRISSDRSLILVTKAFRSLCVAERSGMISLSGTKETDSSSSLDAAISVPLA